MIRAARALPVLVAAVVMGGLGLAAPGASAAPSAPSAPSTSSTSAQPAARHHAVAPITPADWPSFLDGPLHSSYAASQTAITVRNARKLVLKWHFRPGDDYIGSPIVADGAIFIGSTSGWFYKLNPKTGGIEHKIFTGYRITNIENPTGCVFPGISDTASVAIDPRDHQPTVYIGSSLGYLYALRASNLSVKWKSVIALPTPGLHDYYQWSSPTVSSDRIYIGVASACIDPFVRGALVAFNQVTGAKLSEYYIVPKGDLGGAIWSSAAVAPNGDVYASTGSGPNGHETLGLSEAILKFSPDLTLLGSWQVPVNQTSTDGDMGGSPVFFGKYVGACDKNGTFYAVRQSNMRLVWKDHLNAANVANILAECLGPPAYDGKYLYLGLSQAMIGGKLSRGGIAKIVAATGKVVWERPLGNGVCGSPTLDRGGVLAVGTFDNNSLPHAVNPPNETYLVDASNGKVLKTLVQAWDYAQTVFADNMLFAANSNGVYAWAPPRR